jgi:hypothetical protein
LVTELVDERAFFEAETPRSAPLAACQFGFGRGECGELLLPFVFQATRNQTIVRVDSAIAALSVRGFVAGAFDVQSPLGKCRIVVDACQDAAGVQQIS